MKASKLMWSMKKKISRAYKRKPIKGRKENVSFGPLGSGAGPEKLH